MELTINLVHDVVYYNEVTKNGLLKNELFGCTKFTITEFSEGVEVEFIFEGATLDTLWGYSGYLTDQGILLHIKF